MVPVQPSLQANGHGDPGGQPDQRGDDADHHGLQQHRAQHLPLPFAAIVAGPRPNATGFSVKRCEARGVRGYCG
jgi:hypothetical protein